MYNYKNCLKNLSIYMAKKRGKVIKRRPEGLLCDSLKETYLHDYTLRPGQIVYLKAFSLR